MAKLTGSELDAMERWPVCVGDMDVGECVHCDVRRLVSAYRLASRVAEVAADIRRLVPRALEVGRPESGRIQEIDKLIEAWEAQ